MNLDLFRSRHALWAGTLVLVCIVWHAVVAEPFGSRDPRNVGILLTTGWLATALFVVVAAYALRKAAHSAGLSPELRRRLPVAQLERAQSALTALANRIAAREPLGRAEIARAARAVLREHGVQRILRVRVRPDAAAGLSLKVEPRQPLGRLAFWMHAHLYYGLASAALVAFHGGGRLGSTMGILLNGLTAVVVVTGVVGILLWCFGPAWLTRMERELSIEKVFVLREHYSEKVRVLAVTIASRQGATALHGDSLRRLARGDGAEPSHLDGLRAAALEAGPARDLAVLLTQQSAIEREWTRLGRCRGFLNAWRLVHVPCSILLLALVVVHAFSIWIY